MATTEPCSSSRAPAARAGVRRRCSRTDCGASRQKYRAARLACIKQSRHSRKSRKERQAGGPPAPPTGSNRDPDDAMSERGRTCFAGVSSDDRKLEQTAPAAHMQWILLNCLLSCLAPLCGVRWWIGWAFAAVASFLHVRMGRGGRPPRSTAQRHSDMVGVRQCGTW